MRTSFPIALSPSPVYLAFEGIQGDPIDKLPLSEPEKKFIRRADEVVLEYTLQQQSDAEAYAQVLLKLIDYLTSAPTGSNQKVPKLPIDTVLPDDEALPLLYVDTNGVMTHYVIQRLCDVISSLRSTENTSLKVTLASVFYPDGILLENTRSLLRMLMMDGHVDLFAQRGAAFCLSCLLLQGQQLQKQHFLLSPISSILESFVSWMTSRLQSGGPKSITVLTPALVILVVDGKTRELFDATGGVGYLSRNLQIKQSASVQQLYELSYCLWILSYDVDKSEDIRIHFHRDGAVPALVDLIAAAPREKVVRVALSALCNLAACDPQHIAVKVHKRPIDGHAFLKEMLGCGLLRALDLMKQRNWNDEDFIKGSLLFFWYKLLK
jgi:V-type H+-transporting ATPase subunit H